MIWVSAARKGMNEKMIKTAIMGFGTVGSGVYEIIRDKSFAGETGDEIEVKYILDIRDFDDDEIKPMLTKNFEDILNDDEVNIAAEVMGGLHPAYEFTKQLLEKGKSVVTSNKELVATYGRELLETAQKNNALYMFEASVGGGIPVIRPMTVCTKANNITAIAGILNGTTNYILNEMFKKGKDFNDALADAQAKGYAEKNPAADIEGHDACRKLAILSSMAWGKVVNYNDIPTSGITDISLRDVAYVEKLSSVIKLIGYAMMNDEGKVYASVSPMIVPGENILSDVNGVFNAVMIRGNYLGDLVFYGKGAGKLPTASAVVADILDCSRHIGAKKHNIIWEETDEKIIADANEQTMTFLVRCRDNAQNIEKVFGDIEFVPVYDDETAFLVKDIKRGRLNAGLEKINGVIHALGVLDIR